MKAIKSYVHTGERNMWQALIGPASDLLGGWLNAVTEAKVAMKKAEAKVYETKATSSMLMEQQLTKQMEGSWKDEFWVIIFGSILVTCFLPWTQSMSKTDLSSLTNIRTVVCELPVYFNQRKQDANRRSRFRPLANRKK